MTAESSSLVADPHYGPLKEHLIRSTGLAYYTDKDEDLAGRIGRRLAALGMRDCASYLDILHDPEKGEGELAALAAELTIGETYFFRHSEQFDALRQIVLPDILERNRASRRLRIWSAGCATGAEPYSVAVLLRRDLVDQIAGWEVTILGTDVNRSFLARAREGRFEEWALRATSEDLRHCCFERQGNSWALRPEYREWVSFQYHNLAKHPFPSLVHNLAAFDLILCRNVMIYFGPAVIASIVERFEECLVGGGWLVVGHAEPNTEVFRQFLTVNAPGATLYQKAAGYQKAAAVPAPLPNVASTWLPIPPAVPPTPAIELPYAALPARQAPEPKPSPRASPDDLRPDDLPTVLALADRGDWAAASACCRRLLEADGLDPAVHFYHALILEQLGFPGEAELSLRRVLYLDRGFVLAHYHLGLFLQKNRNAAQAVRSFENVLELLCREDDGAVFPGSDGMTVADLKELTRMHLEVLRGEVLPRERADG
ncbi:MAG TPA: protein-glutamate O-methyltransferase CheR [Bryobacterales bacterium]|nr:protein-glutamate O-methyltransferase CheR [Bryobacterales bacterium]